MPSTLTSIKRVLRTTSKERASSRGRGPYSMVSVRSEPVPVRRAPEDMTYPAPTPNPAESDNVPVQIHVQSDGYGRLESRRRQRRSSSSETSHRPAATNSSIVGPSSPQNTQPRRQIATDAAPVISEDGIEVFTSDTAYINATPKEQAPQPRQVASQQAKQISTYHGRSSQGVLAVQGAGVPAVNGAYRCTGVADSVGMYTKESVKSGKQVTFTVYRCRHSSGGRRWYISIVAKGQPPGTKHDIDMYTALSSSSSPGLNERPPESGWRVVVGSGLAGSAPMCLWIPDTEEKADEDDKNMIKNRRLAQCVVCLEKPVQYVFVPCGHPSVCGDCAQMWAFRMPNGKGRPCPVCRYKVAAVIRFFGTVVEDEETDGEDKDEEGHFVNPFCA